MERLLKVKCGNPYFRGEMHGVKFEPQTGGAVGMAPQATAAKIAKEKNFSCPELDALPRTFSDIKGVGAATADKLEDAGVNNLQQLIDADPAQLAEKIESSEDKVKGWQEQAAQLLKPAAE